MFGPLPLRSARGALGTLRWYYHIAAGVIDFVIVWDPPRQVFRLHGGLVAPDAFKLTQRPLEFVAPQPGSRVAVRWPVQTITIVDNRVTATLGHPGAATNHEPLRAT